jgi:hypothetical protein
VRKKLVLCLLGFLLMAGEVYAQEGLRDRDRTFAASQAISTDLRRARFRSGPFYLLSSIELSDIGYQSQFFVPTSDQGSGISFGLSAPQKLYYVPTKKTIFSVTATPQYTFFGGNSSQSSHNQFGYLTRGDAQFLFNHLYLDVFAERSDLLVPYTAEINRIVTQKRDRVGVASEVKYSSKTSFTLQASTNRTRFPSSRYQPTDIHLEFLTRSDQTYRSTLVHKTFPLTTLHLAAERSNYRFPFGPERDSHRTYYGAGFVFTDKVNSLQAEAGPARLDFKDASQRDYKGVIGNAQYGRKGPTYAFTLSGSRDVDFSLYDPNMYYILDRATARIDYLATRRLTLRAYDTAGVDRYEIPTLSAPGGIFVRRRDNMNFIAVGWEYAFTRLRGGFDIGYYKRTSNVAVETEDGIRGILHLSFTP